jgi:L-asparaginase/beta-aspartyl-peptidase (threonine type)
MKPLVIVHGGAGAPAGFADGPQAAAVAGFETLSSGGTALEAAIAAAVVMEDDPRFNAGTGSNLRLDGKTIEMDAAVTDSEGLFGAVMALQRTRNPILVARRVADTPHIMICGEGALNFARRLGFPDYDPITPRALKKYARWRAEGRELIEFDLAAHWNFPEEFRAHDTIGAVVRDSSGKFAVANSTGGTTLMLHGRVGDSPIYGAGLYAGPAGAVAATGAGEEIVKRLLCYRVYEWMAAGSSPEEACTTELVHFPDSVLVGLIAANRSDAWGGSNREMPFAAVTETA